MSKRIALPALMVGCVLVSMSTVVVSSSQARLRYCAGQCLESCLHKHCSLCLPGAANQRNCTCGAVAGGAAHAAACGGSGGSLQGQRTPLQRRRTGYPAGAACWRLQYHAGGHRVPGAWRRLAGLPVCMRRHCTCCAAGACDLRTVCLLVCFFLFSSMCLFNLPLASFM